MDIVSIKNAKKYHMKRLMQNIFITFSGDSKINNIDGRRL